MMGKSEGIGSPFHISSQKLYALVEIRQDALLGTMGNLGLLHGLGKLNGPECSRNRFGAFGE
jgi:hypothetical protein